LIIPGLPFRGGDQDLNLTSDSGLFQEKEAQSVSTVSDQRRAPLPTNRGRRTQAAIDTAARTVIARKGILATTIADIAAEAGRSTASFYNYYDSKESMVREWALRFHDEVSERAKPVTQHGLSSRERAQRAAAAHWHTYKHLLAEMVSVSQLAMVNDDFARYWAEICAIPTSFITEMVRRAQADGYCAGDDPQLVAVAIVAMLNQFCYLQLAGPTAAGEPDDEACIATLSNIFYRAIYYKEGR
jgi:AcrR family transcriptional regulator